MATKTMVPVVESLREEQGAWYGQQRICVDEKLPSIKRRGWIVHGG